MKNKLLSLMPEFQQIEGKDLRENTLQIWIDAMAKSGWSVDDLLDMPFTLLIERIKVNIIEHTRAVTLCSLRIGDILVQEYGDKISLNRDFLLSGALLHDVGKLFEYRREGEAFVKSEEGKLLRHPISGAAFAYRYGIPDEVLHIIAAHSKEGDGARRTIEAIIVNHADFVNFDVLKI
ncbi:MAG: HD domain-containing protein [Acidobacteria bacterium]|nr:HD domain-containing protein [Acidobacteriota bacterium]MBU1339204.1 HD domain-containing protein [Acidobacteriota bacterium]MBU1473402.1 HD domain-containing protein [Acidobacteriota bacterium]MBU2438719.1 HD domain-containing protein [Acidobacteriota bacterium]MBU4203083.1 HD domain-containing protein [Acidobacteriota bacterium]